jgi:hypothetical protein
VESIIYKLAKSHQFVTFLQVDTGMKVITMPYFTFAFRFNYCRNGTPKIKSRDLVGRDVPVLLHRQAQV